MTQFLSVEDVVELHRTAAGEHPLLDPSTLAGAVARPQAGFGGEDAHPTLFDKAAALLHGIASTQCFQDGNKRVAWVAAVTFLEVNGHLLRDVPEIDAEAFVIAVATSAWTDRTLSKAAAWFEAQGAEGALGEGSATMPAGVPMPVASAVTALMVVDHAEEQGGVLNISRGGWAWWPVSQIPTEVHVSYAMTVHAEPNDQRDTISWTAWVAGAGRQPLEESSTETFGPWPEAGDVEGAPATAVAVGSVPFIASRTGRFYLVVSVEGGVPVAVPFAVRLVPLPA